MSLPLLLTGLCDDAALFPPGDAPLESALPAHAAHESAAHADLVGTFVFPAGRLEELSGLLARRPYPGTLELSLTVPDVAGAPGALATASALPDVRVAALEVAMPVGQDTGTLLAGLRRAVEAQPDLEVFVEVPRDERRAEVVAALAGTPYLAKLRTGGLVAQAHPDEAELAAVIAALVHRRVPFKATAGLHHAVRRTDPATGFEQHGFANVAVAVADALAGAGADRLALVLAERDGAALASRLAAMDEHAQRSVRGAFRSFGTCSIADPLHDLLALGLVPATIPPIPEGHLA